MVCVLFVDGHGVNSRWFDGSCGSQRQNIRGHIAQEVWDAIPDVWAPDEMRFGRNCAEVQALKKLFGDPIARDIFSDDPSLLSVCRFIAMDKGRNVRAPCGGCSIWMHRFGIQAYWDNAWRVP